MSELSNAERQRLAMLGEMKISETRNHGTASKYIHMWESTDPSIYQRWEVMAVIDALYEAGHIRSVQMTEEESIEALVDVIDNHYDRSSGPNEAWSVQGLAMAIVDAGFAPHI